MKKSQKKKQSKKKDEVLLELDGKINLVEITGGKTTRTELDGEACLTAILKVIENYLYTIV